MRPSVEHKPQASAKRDRNSGRRDWFVIRWKNHPKEKANRAFGRGIATVLVDFPDLQPNWHEGGAA